MILCGMAYACSQFHLGIL